MSPNDSRMPGGREAEEAWRELGRERRTDIIIKGDDPASEREATTALAYARRMQERNGVFALLGAVSAFVVWLAISMLFQDQLGGQDFLLAGAIGVAVGLGLGFGGRLRANNLEERAEDALAQWK